MSQNGLNDLIIKSVQPLQSETTAGHLPNRQSLIVIQQPLCKKLCLLRTKWPIHLQGLSHNKKETRIQVPMQAHSFPYKLCWGTVWNHFELSQVHAHVCAQRERKKEKTWNSELYYSRIEILGICLFLQSVLANLHASTYKKTVRTYHNTMMKMTMIIYWWQS